VISAASSPFGPSPARNAHALALPATREYPLLAQRFHMYENIRRVRPARDEAVTLAAVEPLHGCVEGRPCGSAV